MIKLIPVVQIVHLGTPCSDDYNIIFLYNIKYIHTTTIEAKKDVFVCDSEKNVFFARRF